MALLEKAKKRNRYLSIEKIRLTKQNKRKTRLKLTYEQEKKQLLPLTNKQLKIAGLFLYWGEGGKTMTGQVSLNNTDPQVVKFTLYWLINALKIPKSKIKVFLHLYSDMDIDKKVEYWSKQLRIPISQFVKPYIKQSKITALNQKSYGHGTCGLAVNDTRLKEKIIMGIQSIADFYTKKIDAIM